MSITHPDKRSEPLIIYEIKNFIHPASREGDQADLPTPQGRRPPPTQLGGGGLAYGLRCCVKTTTEHNLASREEAGEGGTRGEGPPVGAEGEQGHQGVVGGVARPAD